MRTSIFEAYLPLGSTAGMGLMVRLSIMNREAHGKHSGYRIVLLSSILTLPILPSKHHWPLALYAIIQFKQLSLKGLMPKLSPTRLFYPQ